MTDRSRLGRPRLSSRETIAEAACELFLEAGYDEASITDIARRAGVGRSTFFNYFGSKSDVLWSGLDARIDRLERSPQAPRDAVRSVLVDFAPDSLALALAQADTMGLTQELEREGALRQARIARILRPRVSTGSVEAEILSTAYGAAVIAAIREWARQGAGRVSLPDILERAIAVIPSGPGGETAPSA